MGTAHLNEGAPTPLVKCLSKRVQEVQATPCPRATAGVIARPRAMPDSEGVLSVRTSATPCSDLGPLSRVMRPASPEGPHQLHRRGTQGDAFMCGSRPQTGTRFSSSEEAAPAHNSHDKRRGGDMGGSGHFNDPASTRQDPCAIVTSALWSFRPSDRATGRHHDFSAGLSIASEGNSGTTIVSRSVWCSAGPAWQDRRPRLPSPLWLRHGRRILCR